MKMIKKICSAALILFQTFVFAESYQICLGSFHSLENAENRKKILTDNDIQVSISEYQKSDDEKLYRVVYDEILADKQNALLHKEMLSNLDIVKNLEIDDVWLVQIDGAAALPSEIKDGRFLLITDSDTGNPVPDADVNIDQKWDVKSSSEGKAPLPDAVEDGEHSLTVKKDGEYVETSGNFTVQDGAVSSAPQISIPKAVDYDRIKIVLNWGETPSDLDSHIFNKNYHVYYMNKDAGNLNLDRDDTTSYGPETVTIRDPDKNDVYKYFVFNYSDDYYPSSDRMSFSNAQVQLFFGNTLQKVFKIKEGQAGITWHVFDIVNGDQIVVHDTVTGDYPSYDD